MRLSVAGYIGFLPPPSKERMDLIFIEVRKVRCRKREIKPCSSIKPNRIGLELFLVLYFGGRFFLIIL
jgi:hypothetical protein